MSLDALDMVLVGGEWRAVGFVSAEDLEELERMHDTGDARAESRLELLRRGRPAERALTIFRADPPPPRGSWSNDFRGGEAEAACAATIRRKLGR